MSFTLELHSFIFLCLVASGVQTGLGSGAAARKAAPAVRCEPRLLQGEPTEPQRCPELPAGAEPARPDPAWAAAPYMGMAAARPGPGRGGPLEPRRAEPGAARPRGLSQTKNSPGNQIRKWELEDFRIGAEGEMPGKPGKQSVCRELLSVVLAHWCMQGIRGWRTCLYPSVIFSQQS